MLGPEDHFDELSLPLQKGSFPEQSRLVSAWNNLSSADLKDPGVFEDVLFILEHTSPEKSEKLPLKSLEQLAQTPASPKPTAANPRAFKGTKRQPPKSAADEKVDLRPYLLNLQGTRQLIALDKKLQQRFSSKKDPFLVANFDCPETASYFSLPLPFRVLFLPFLRGKNWALVTDYLKLFYDLSIDSELGDLCLLILNRFGAEKTYPVLTQLLTLEAENRFDTLNTIFAVLKTKDFSIEDIPNTLIETAKLYSDCAEFSDVLLFTLTNLSRKSNLYLIEFALQLFREFGQTLPTSYKRNLLDTWHLFEYNDDSANIPAVQIKNFLSQMVGQDSGFNQWNEQVNWLKGLSIAEKCVKSDDFRKSFLQINWKRFTPSLAHHYCYSLIYHLELCKYQDILDNYFIEHGDSDCSHTLLFELSDIVSDYSDDLKKLDSFVNWFLPIAKIDGAIDASFGSLLYLVFSEVSNKNRQLLIEMSDSSLCDFIKECKRLNDTRLIEIGLKDLVETQDSFVVQSLNTNCRSFLNATKIFGCLNKTRRKELLISLKNDPIFQLESTRDSQSLKNTLKLLAKNSNLFSISRKLKESLLNGEPISDDVVSRVAIALNTELPRIKVKVFQNLVNNSLAPGRSFNDQPNSVKHAFKILNQNNNQDNVRAFKRFLFSYLDGDIDYLKKHPRTKEWLAKHKQLNLEPWINGLQKRYHSEKNKNAYKLKIELDPLEELKHGTYVGSCTGFGGQYSDSALATVLDVNKKVIYALNEKNEVVARQLLAISKDVKLICYQVYPDKTKVELKNFFKKFDQELASIMGIEIMPDDAEYQIECLISSFWFDDCPIHNEKKKLNG